MIYNMNINEVFLWEQGGQNIESGREINGATCEPLVEQQMSCPPLRKNSLHLRLGNNPCVDRPPTATN